MTEYTVDLTLDKNYFASDAYQNPSAAFDGNVNTSWRTAATTPGYVGVDFGEEIVIEKLKIASVATRMKDFKLQASNNMTTWEDIFSNEGTGKRYLLRTICTESVSRIPTTLADGNVFCDSNQWYEDSNGNTQYICYQFSDKGDDYVPKFVPR